MSQLGIGIVFPETISQNQQEIDNWQGLKLWYDYVSEELGGIESTGSTLSAVSISPRFVSVEDQQMHNNTEAFQAAQALCNQTAISAITCPDRLAVECVRACAPLEKVQLLLWKDKRMCSGPTDSFGNDGDNVFCISLKPDLASQGAMKTAVNYGYERAATLGASQRTSAESEVDLLEAKAEANGLDVVVSSTYDDESSLSSVISTAQTENVDAFFFSSTNKTLEVLQEMKAQDYTPSIIWANGSPEKESWSTIAGEDGNYVTTTKQWHHRAIFADEVFGSSGEYSELYLQTYGEYPSEDAALGTMVGLALHHAVQGSYGETDVDAIIDGLLGLSTDTLFGRVRFDMNQRNVGRDLLTLQWQSQEGSEEDAAIDLQVILPVEAASASWVHPVRQWGCRPGALEGVCDEIIGISSLTSSVFLAISGAGIFLSILLFAGLIHFRKRAGFAVSGHPFVGSLVVSGLLGFLAMLSFIMDPVDSGGASSSVCMARLWLTGLGGLTALSALFSKPALLLILKRRRSLRDYPPVFMQCALICCPLFLGCVLLMMWTWLATPSFAEKEVNGVRYPMCSSSNGYLWLVYCYVAVLLCFSVVLSWMTKTLPSVFVEAKYVHFALVAVSFVLVLLVIIVNTLNQTPDSFAIISCVGIAFISCTVWGLVLGPRYVLYLNQLIFKKGEAYTQSANEAGGLSNISTNGIQFATKSESSRRLIGAERTRMGLHNNKRIHANAITSLEQAIPDVRRSSRRQHTC